MSATGQYFDPTIPKVYSTYQEIRYLYPNVSIPRNKDLPSLNLYQIFFSTPPVAETGFYAALKQFPELDTPTGTYKQAWEILPIPAEP